MHHGRPFGPGEKVLLVDSRHRRYLITLAEGREFHSHRGILAHDDIIGAAEGTSFRSTQGSVYMAFRPTLGDFVLKMKRGAQVVYPKDVGAILVYADIFPGATVLEAGSGSASLTLALARAVGPDGRVISYELREDHHLQARENVEAWYAGSGSSPAQLDLRIGDIFEGVPEENVDRLVLDLPEPWKAVGPATDTLASGGLMCSYVPTVPQVQSTVDAMKRGGFGFLDTFEVLLRTWNIDGQSVRPDHRMVAHTGFITIGRKFA